MTMSYILNIGHFQRELFELLKNYLLKLVIYRSITDVLLTDTEKF